MFMKMRESGMTYKAIAEKEGISIYRATSICKQARKVDEAYQRQLAHDCRVQRRYVQLLCQAGWIVRGDFVQPPCCLKPGDEAKAAARLWELAQAE